MEVTQDVDWANIVGAAIFFGGLATVGIGFGLAKLKKKD
jgi:hypothetical protein